MVKKVVKNGNLKKRSKIKENLAYWLSNLPFTFGAAYAVMAALLIEMAVIQKHATDTHYWNSLDTNRYLV